MWNIQRETIEAGDVKSIARAISLVETESEGYEDFLKLLPASTTPIIGVTGPPGAGKSTLTDSLIEDWVGQGKSVAVLCIDPSSPFSRGAVLGDRIRMNRWYNNPNVFIRSLASRGSLGGLHPNILEITDLLKAAPFDNIIIETVGVGQSEIEIAGIADTTVVVVVPEAGDDVQMMKAGLLEIADIFVVNKADRPDAEKLAVNLRMMVVGRGAPNIPVLKTSATEKKGISELIQAIAEVNELKLKANLKIETLAKKAWYLIQKSRMKDLNFDTLKNEIRKDYKMEHFNLYRFLQERKL